MRQKKYNLIPEHQIKKPTAHSEFSVTITASLMLYIKPFDVDMWGLDGKTVKFYADIDNKTLAWREVTGGSLSTLENVRVMQKQAGGNMLISVGKLLKQMGITPEMLPMKQVPVMDYNDQMEKQKYKIVDLRDHIPVKRP